MDYDFWSLMAAYCVGFGILVNKVHNLEKRIDGNGAVSIPGRCHLHAQQLKDNTRRIVTLESTTEPQGNRE